MTTQEANKNVVPSTKSVAIIDLLRQHQESINKLNKPSFRSQSTDNLRRVSDKKRSKSLSIPEKPLKNAAPFDVSKL